jgi:hypothetical protein
MADLCNQWSAKLFTLISLKKLLFLLQLVHSITNLLRWFYSLHGNGKHWFKSSQSNHLHTLLYLLISSLASSRNLFHTHPSVVPPRHNVQYQNTLGSNLRHGRLEKCYLGFTFNYPPHSRSKLLFYSLKSD